MVTMDKKTLREIKTRLLRTKNTILNRGFLRLGDDLRISPDDLPSETDMASRAINQQIIFNIRERELQKLRAIEDALYRIEKANFGLCEECDQPIGKKRLLTSPWTTLCIAHAEEFEREQAHFLRPA